MSKKSLFSYLSTEEQTQFNQLPQADKQTLLKGGFPVMLIRKLIPIRLNHASK